MLINLFFSFSILISQLYTTDTFEFTVFNKTVVIQDSVESVSDTFAVVEENLIYSLFRFADGCNLIDR